MKPTTTTNEDWRIPANSRSRYGEVELFCDRASISPGESMRIFLQTANPAIISVWRLGDHAGFGCEHVVEIGVVGPCLQSPPLFEPETGLISCSNWEPSLDLQIPSDWRSGVYSVRADTRQTLSLRSADALFVVTTQKKHDVIVVIPVTTWAAYNSWGGRSLYDIGGNTSLPKAVQVSFDRPMKPDYPPLWTSVQGHPFFVQEYPLIRFLEREGYQPSYVTNLELHQRRLPACKLIISAGHDEYWSRSMRDTLDGALGQGSNLFWAGANGMCWQIRLEDSKLGTDRVITCYKDHLSDPMMLTDPAHVTGRWGDWPLYRPESETLGVNFVDWDFTLNRRPAAWIAQSTSHPIFNGTNLSDGDRVPGIIGDEWDAFDPNCPGADTAVILGETEELIGANLGPCRGHTVLRKHNGGGYILATGSINWSWGLDSSTVEDRETQPDPRIQKLTRNFIDAAIGGVTW